MAVIRSHIGAGNSRKDSQSLQTTHKIEEGTLSWCAKGPHPGSCVCLSRLRILRLVDLTRASEDMASSGLKRELPLALPGANSQSCGDASLIGWHTIQGFIRHRPDWPGMTGTSEQAFCLLQSIRCCSMWSMACLSKDALNRRNSSNSPFWNSSCCRFAPIQRRSSMNIAILCSWMKVLARFSAQKLAQYALRLTKYWPRNPSKRIISIQFSKSLTKSFGGPY